MFFKTSESLLYLEQASEPLHHNHLPFLNILLASVFDHLTEDTTSQISEILIACSFQLNE